MARPADKSSNESEKSSEKPTSETPSSSSPSEAQGEGKDAKDRSAASGGAASTPAFIERMKGQHKALQAILDKRTTASAEPFAIAEEFAAAWLPHNLIEREILRETARGGGAAEAVAEVEIRKDLLNFLLANLIDEGPRGAEKAALEALAEQFSALVQAGEREEGGLFQAVDSFLASGRLPLSQIERRYERSKQRFEHLDGDAIGEAIELLAPRRLSVPEERRQSERERDMPRYSSQTRDRDEQGRFLPEDERDYGRGGYRSMPQRDEGGRFLSEERRGRGRYDDDDRRSGSRGRSHGGWFGDSEGHSEASRRGWEDSDHGRSGWHGDREGHSEASRRGWENSDHGRSGWYGDPGAHSEASRRGWDEGHRSSQRRDEDNGRTSQRSRYEMDDRRSTGERRR